MSNGAVPPIGLPDDLLLVIFVDTKYASVSLRLFLLGNGFQRRMRPS